MLHTRADFRVTQDYLFPLYLGQDTSGTWCISKPDTDQRGETWNWEPLYAGDFPIYDEIDGLTGQNPWRQIFAIVAPDADPERYVRALPIQSIDALVNVLRQVSTHGRYLKIRKEDKKGRSK